MAKIRTIGDCGTISLNGIEFNTDDDSAAIDKLHDYLLSDEVTPEKIFGGGEGNDKGATAEGEGEGKESIKNLSVEKERLERGLKPIESQLRKFKEEGKRLVDSGEIDPPQLVAELIANPRAPYPEEHAALRYYKSQLKDKLVEVRKNMEDAVKSNDEGKMSVAVAQRTQLEDMRNDLELALRKGGTEAAYSLLSRKDDEQDYSLEEQVQRMREVNLGQPITEELRKKLEGYEQQLNEANKKLEEHEKRFKELETKKVEKKIKSDADFEERKEKRATQKERIQKERVKLYDELKKLAREQASKLSAIPVPVEMIPTLAKLARSYAKEGVTDLVGIADQIHQNVKDYFDGSPEDIHDALLQYNDEKRLETYKKNLQKQKEDISQKIEKKQFQTEQRRPLKIDREGELLKADVERIKRRFDTEKFKLEKENRNAVEKFADFVTKWHRLDLLSGITTLGKLSTAAIERIALTPAEEITGGVIGKIPGISWVAKQAPREGGFNLKAEVQSFTNGFSKATARDMIDMIRSGKSPMDLLYGKKYDLPAEAIGFFGQVHSALKVLPKRAEFYRSYEKRMNWYGKNGFDLQDPTVQAKIAGEAYNDSMRAIFMQDNLISDAYKIGLNYLENKGASGKAAAFVLRNLMPIVKVPTNIAGETLSYAGGGLKAAFVARKQLHGTLKLAMGVKSGIDKLTPDQADAVMRNLKKQTIGAGFLMLGYFGYQNVGGYYTGKRPDDDVEAGGISMFGVELPRWMVHNPLLEMLQVGATIHRVQDAYEFKGKEKGTEAGILAAAKGVAEQVPFFNMPTQVERAIGSPNAADKFTDEYIKNATIPIMFQEMAKWLDTDSEGKPVKRYPTSVGETLETGIPFMREDAPNAPQKKINAGGGGGGGSDY